MLDLANQTMNGRDITLYLDDMTQGYIDALLFTAPEEWALGQPGEFRGTLGHSHGLSRIPAATHAQCRETCRRFLLANHPYLTTYAADDAGMDLWYTRNGHGVGFWEEDHCTKDEGSQLTAAAHRLGECHPYRGAGGWIYLA